ncbi:nodulation-related efflux transporter subunit NolF [Fluviicoccus keumensis]|uniref:Nodulation-related efflux transporter subunit NolF n=1 Tax=Fluviicoccus keumensis TaxID=1435465 RepID=A0A4Q7YE49_9GAMM|nr:efflux RND transporter periplasmic adaptor subunit [Fluviicoccus keumensis]RZU35400.1 nodulation-related efflux transporter subunit NolF [Fluviicoccus keumensis]
MTRLVITRQKTYIPASWLKYGAVGVAVALVAWWPQESRSKMTPAVQPLQLTGADLAVVKQVRLAQDVPVTGSLNPLHQAVLNARTGGEVMMVAARAGELVRAGQVLASLDTRDLKLRAMQAEASLQGNRAEALMAADKLERMRPLREQNYVSDNDVSNAQRQVEIRNAQVRASEASLAQIRQQMADAVVRAPFDGRVAERLVEPGQSVAPGTPMLKVVDLGLMELEAMVPDADMTAIHTGQVVNFEVDGFPGKTFAGRIVRINPVARTGSRRVPVYVQVNNQDGLLRAGVFAKGLVRDDRAMQGLAVPVSSLQAVGAGWRVHAVANSHLEARNVKIAMRNDERGLALVTGNLNAGERVLLAPPLPENEGKAVRLTGAH